MTVLHRLTAVAVAAAGLVLPAMTVTAAPAAAAVTYRVLITGDSITQGSSGDYTWRYRLWNKLADTAPGKVSFVGTRSDLFDIVNNTSGSTHYAASFSAKAHSAKWGDSFIDELDAVGSQVTKSGANTLVVMLGSNDLAFATSPAETIAHARTYIERARKARPGIDVVIGEVVNRYDPWTATYSLGSETAEYADRLRDLASDLSTSSQRVVVAPTRDGWDAKVHTWDGTHPNPTGEKVIAQRVSEGLAKLGIGSSSPNIISTTGWRVAGPKPTLTAASEAANLKWSRTASGATGMFVEQRLTNTNEAWRRLPYAVAGNGWKAELLAAGGTYQYRLVPSKGSSTGLAGSAASVKTTGPKLGAISSVKLENNKNSLYGGKAIHASWSASSNASGYVLASRTMSTNAPAWDTLPYAIEGRDWNFEPLAAGRRFIFRVTPVRGFLTATARKSAAARTDGLAGKRTYVALGDSYSAGLGAPGLETSGGCFRSANAWAFRMQYPLNSKTYLYACSGATIEGRKGMGSVRNQVPAMKKALAKVKGRPEIVTVTVGGNDVGFSDVVRLCILGSCTGNESKVAKKITALQPKLRSVYSSIKSSAPYADIMAGGYPAVLEPTSPGPGAGCGLISGSERAMASRLATSLNTRIASAAADAGIWSVGQNIWEKFRGHNACSSSAWIHAVNGAVNGELLHAIDNKSFHPNSGGQLAYAQVFSDKINLKAGVE